MPRRPSPAHSENSLLGDLESIRSLLDFRDGQAAGVALPTEEESREVPMLDDVVEGALRVDESPLASRHSFEGQSDGPSMLADETIEALMGDEWRESAERIIRTARQAMASAAARWSDHETSSVQAALRTRIDGALHDWMAEVTLNHIDALRQRLLDAIDDEVRNITDQLSRAPDGQ